VKKVRGLVGLCSTDPRGLRQEIAAGVWLDISECLLNAFLFSCTFPAKPSYFKAHYLNDEFIFLRYFSLKLLESRTLEFIDCAASEAGQMKVIFLRSDFVVMLFAIQVHQVKFINQTEPLQELNRPVHRCAIDSRIALPRHLKKGRRIQMSCRLLDRLHQCAALCSQAHTLCF
jgi:hypothetical protein